MAWRLFQASKLTLSSLSLHIGKIGDKERGEENTNAFSRSPQGARSMTCDPAEGRIHKIRQRARMEPRETSGQIIMADTAFLCQQGREA